MNLYSPPGGAHPQELPDRWRFENGEVRTDLKSLTSAQLKALDWTGPIIQLKPFAVKVDENGEPIIDEDGNEILEGDYDPETHKVVWYRARRKYEIVEKNVDETPYVEGQHLNETGEIAKWGEFKTALLSSALLNAFVVSAAPYAPIACTALPAVTLDVENTDYNNFRIVWSTILSSVPEVPEGLIAELQTLCLEYHIPQEFIEILIPTNI